MKYFSLFRIRPVGHVPVRSELNEINCVLTMKSKFGFLPPWLVVTGLGLLLVGRVMAQNLITVTNSADSGAGTLRQAIADAAPGDTIDFAVSGTITLFSQL